jgi:hypothetical protein
MELKSYSLICNRIDQPLRLAPSQTPSKREPAIYGWRCGAQVWVSQSASQLRCSRAALQRFLTANPAVSFRLSRLMRAVKIGEKALTTDRAGGFPVPDLVLDNLSQGLYDDLR